MSADAPEPDRLAAMATVAKAAWPHLLAFVGAVFALSIVEKLTPLGRVLGVCFGLTVATAVGPLANAALIHFAPFLPAQAVAGGLGFLIGLSALPLIPPLLKALRVKMPTFVDGLLKKVSPE